MLSEPGLEVRILSDSLSITAFFCGCETLWVFGEKQILFDLLRNCRYIYLKVVSEKLYRSEAMTITLQQYNQQHEHR